MTRLAGLWGFALTPFREADSGNGSIDADAYCTGIDRMARGGADVICAAGTLGQGDRMTPDERIACIRWAVAAASGLPVVGTLTAGDEPAVAASALEAGASAVLLLPTSGLVDDAARTLALIAGATDHSLPIVLYQRGTLFLEPTDLRRLAEEPALVGLKDAHGDMRRFRRLREALGARLTWIGASEDLILAFWAYGADAVSPASLAYAPWYARRVWDALTRGDRDEAVRLLRLFAWPVTDLRLSRPNIDVTVARELAREFGVEVGAARSQAERLTEAELAEVRRLADILRSQRPATSP